MPGFIANYMASILPRFIKDMVARGFWWALLANIIFQVSLVILSFIFVFISELILVIIAKIRGKTREKETADYSDPYLSLLGLLFPFYIWHIRHGVGWLIYAIVVTVFAAILVIYRVNKKDNKGDNTNNATAYVNRGKEHVNKKDYDSAIADFNEAIRINPNDSSVYFYRGYAYYNKNNYDSAIANYSLSIKIDPNNPVTYFNRGNAYFNKNDYSNAIVDYSLSMKINPNNASTYFCRGYAYEAIGDKQRALTDYQSAVQLDPNETMYRDNLKRIMGL
jgi:tetratricopeptide (TPR) repeat protein